jgi:integrase
VRVKLKGIASATKKLSDGTRVKYYWAWRGGPRLEGKPGTPEFIASYNQAVSEKIAPARDTLQSIVDSYLGSDEFTSLAPRTQKNYQEYIKLISAKFSGFPLAGLSNPRARGIFLAWRDDLGKKSKSTADYAWSVLARIMSYALNRGLVAVNPCKEGGRLYSGSRASSTWSATDEAAFMASASEPLCFAMQLALWTGQRQGDLLTLTWADYDGRYIRLRQSKTGARVTIPVAAKLKETLDAKAEIFALKNPNDKILTNQAGRPWTSDGFKTSWGKACGKAGITDLTFHDLRGTAVCRLAAAGCSVPEIATLSGHSLATVNEILDKHYFSRDVKLAESAIAKLEAHGKEKL